ncbi:AP complex subunit sigma [Mycena sanguinolenta]|uniref:AP-1 complex subunit sigma-1 n=1 Tax=Mycena sanguinolenta TaxID=230812 RepID=A0A8H7D0Y2_9AGAR|nr:AP complex subunit sigma [Mycena sanguinolenta]
MSKGPIFFFSDLDNVKDKSLASITKHLARYDQLHSSRIASRLVWPIYLWDPELTRSAGKVRLSKWFTTTAPKAKAKIVKDVTQLVLARRTRMYTKVVYRRYASLFFVCGIGSNDNELVTLEIIHRYVEVLDRYFGNVCELDLIFNFQKAYAILDELIISGELQESSKKSVLRVVTQSDSVEEQETSEDTMARLGSRSG